jgi:hypothetical protein
VPPAAERRCGELLAEMKANGQRADRKRLAQFTQERTSVAAGSQNDLLGDRLPWELLLSFKSA